jgi:hypothetical protein
MKLRTFSALASILVLLSACALPGGAGDEADCLQGNWVMSNEDFNIMLLTLVPVPGLSIPVGTLLMNFEGDQFVYGSDAFTLQIDLPGGYMSADASFATDGTFSAADGMLTFADMVTSRNVSTWVAVIDGEVAEAPGSFDVSMPAPGGGPYSCEGDLLAITSIAPSGEPFAMIFQRQP